MWNEITRVIASEFSDLNDIEQFTRACVRLFLAGLLGALLGVERERAGKSAGLRTHMLVALGAALFVLVPLQGGADHADISRVVQGVVAGVGFLCAGTIIKAENSEDRVRGLTTSAGLWMTAAIGVAAGLGREMTAVLAALLAFAVLALEDPLMRLIRKSPTRDV